jgi:hypothetical protein
MGLFRAGLVLLAVSLSAVPSSAQGVLPRCLHGQNETATQAERREEALDAMDLINRVLERHPKNAAFPTWEALAKSPAVASFRGMSGKRGELARKMTWGTDQPLPGWRIHYVAAQDAYAFSLTDMRDSCQFTYSSNDTGVVIEGRPANGSRRPRVVPLDSSQ